MALDLSALDGADLTPPKSKKGAAAPSPATAETAPRAPLDRFIDDPDQPRTEMEIEPEFLQDIEERGILQPVVCIPVGDKLKIRFGHRRIFHARAAGLKDAPYVLTEDPRQMDDYAQVSENERRKPLQPLEMANFIAKKIKAGEKKKDIADKLHIDPSAVTHYLALADEPPAFLLELYMERKCRTTQYLYELRKLHEKAPELVEKRCAQADEIDRAFLKDLGAEVSPPKITPLAQTPAGAGGLDNANAGNNGGGSASTGEGAAPAGTPPVQQIPPHNPGIESQGQGSKPPADKIKKPLLLGQYEGRDVMIVLSRIPSTAGLLIVRYEDGSGENEVNAADVRLTMLTESRA